MSTPNPLQAAAPVLIADVQAIKQFVASMGPDPSKWVLNYPGAKLILVGTILQGLPELAQAEGTALDTAIGSHLDAVLAKLQGLRGS